MTTVLHTIVRPQDKEPLANVGCTVKLVGAGFVDGDKLEIVKASVPETDVNGLLTMVLVPNSEIDPAESYYLLTAGGVSWTFVAPEPVFEEDGVTEIPAWLKDCLIVDPQPGPAIVVGNTTFTDNGNHSWHFTSETP